MKLSAMASTVSLSMVILFNLISPVALSAQSVDLRLTPSTLFSDIAVQAPDPDEFTVMTLSSEKGPARRGQNMGTAHTYMGYGTIVLALAAAFSSSNEDVHEPMGYAAASAATLTCITGFMEYGDYFDSEEGFSKYNVHIVSGVAATAGFIITAILGADGDDHGGIGGGSTVLMCVPIISLKW